METMEPRRKEVGRVFVTGICGALGLAATAVMGGCTAGAIVAPEDAMVTGPEAGEVRQASTESSVNGGKPNGEPAEVAAADGDGLPGSSRMFRGTACTSPQPPLIIVDGVRSDLTIREIVALGIVSFEIVRSSVAVAEYGEEGRDGVLLIATRKPGGNGDNDSTAGEPPN